MTFSRPFRAGLAILPATGLLLLLGHFVHGRAQSPPASAIDDSFFSDKLYPVLEKAQCRICHADNGVGSGTRLQFPESGAAAAEIGRFGLGLAALVDSDQPEQSLLFQKPTNRLAHTGGERIPKGSDDEAALLAWVEHLARRKHDPPPGGTEQPSVAVRHRGLVRRLTHRQYNNTVADLLGDQTGPANQFPPEDFIGGFKNQMEGQGISPIPAEAYGEGAEKLARSAFRGGDSQGLIPCEYGLANDEECRARFVREFGGKAFRRPLTAAEIGRFQRLFEQQARRTGEFLDGARVVVEAMLQSPSFLFHAPIEPPQVSTAQRGSFIIASRLSYFLWNTMPDEELFRAAEAGVLNDPEQLAKAARRMLQGPRARLAMEDFLAQWMRFDRVLETIRYRRLFPEFNSELAAAMTEETKRLFSHLVWEDKNFMDLFSADYGFLSSDLAGLYGFAAPAEEFAMVEFPSESGRAGVLGQATFLTLTSKPADTSPTERGLFVREHFLCQNVPPPPPGVNSNLPPVTDAKPVTNRERLSVHVSNEACVSCHRLVDPIGFGFENYDAIGRFRAKHLLKIFPTREEQKSKIKTEATEYALEIDSSAMVQGIAGSDFASPKQLGKILASNATCQKCVVRQLFRYAFGRHESAADRPTIDALYEDFRESGFRFRELIVSLVTSEAFLPGRDRRSRDRKGAVAGAVRELPTARERPSSQ